MWLYVALKNLKSFNTYYVKSAESENQFFFEHYLRHKFMFDNIDQLIDQYQNLM